jgi:BlaI family penicillinase repressor
LEVIKALWAAGADTPRSELETRLSSFGWAPNTVNTYLTRLVKKGFVEVEHRRTGNRYTPRISREEYQAYDSRATLSQLYGSPRNFVAALARHGLEQSELDDLRRLLNELEGESRDG